MIASVQILIHVPIVLNQMGIAEALKFTQLILGVVDLGRCNGFLMHLVVTHSILEKHYIALCQQSQGCFRF